MCHIRIEPLNTVPNKVQLVAVLKEWEVSGDKLERLQSDDFGHELSIIQDSLHGTSITYVAFKEEQHLGIVLEAFQKSLMSAGIMNAPLTTV